MFDAVQAAKQRNVDVLICDTAGRLQNKSNLMEELNKIFRVIQREIPSAPHEVLMVLDATTGQNALTQAKLLVKKWRYRPGADQAGRDRQRRNCCGDPPGNESAGEAGWTG